MKLTEENEELAKHIRIEAEKIIIIPKKNSRKNSFSSSSTGAQKPDKIRKLNDFGGCSLLLNSHGENPSQNAKINFIRIQMSDKLKIFLVDDWEAVNKHKMVQFD